jgi:hypothetical protein
MESGFLLMGPTDLLQQITGRLWARDVIFYLKLAVRVTAIKLEPQSVALSTMLREIAA